MQLMWWDWLRYAVTLICLILLTVAAGMAYARFRRWSLGCLFIAVALLLLTDVFGLTHFMWSWLPIDQIYYYLYMAPWPIAIAGGVGEVLQLTRTSSPSPDSKLPPQQATRV